MLGNRREFLDVDARIVFRAFKCADHRFRAWLGCVRGERSKGRIDDVDTGFDGFEVGCMAETGCAVRVELDRDVKRSLELLDEVFGYIRLEQAGHVLDADGVAAHILQLFSQLDEFFVRMDRADGIDETALDFRLLGAVERCIDGNFEVADIV